MLSTSLRDFNDTLTSLLADTSSHARDEKVLKISLRGGGGGVMPLSSLLCLSGPSPAMSWPPVGRSVAIGEDERETLLPDARNCAPVGRIGGTLIVGIRLNLSAGSDRSRAMLLGPSEACRR